jgi:Leucine-rich repeat (LRR) protein
VRWDLVRHWLRQAGPVRPSFAIGGLTTVSTLSEKSLLFPALASFPDAVHDVAEVPQSATSARLVQKVRNFHELASRPALKRLLCFGIDQKQLQTVSSCEALTQLYIDGLRVDDFSRLARLGNLEAMSLETAHKISSLDGIADFGSLHGLRIEHFKNVKSLAPLRELTQLRALAVAGSIWTRMTVESLSPLSSLRGLKFLHLTNLKPLDNSLEPLRALTSLEELECANFYPMEEFAKLAAALPRTRCDWFNPVMALPDVPCKKCGQCQLVLLTGKGSSGLCRTCDDERIRKHEDSFRSIVSGSK